MRIIETDNFGGDYPDETFVNLPDLIKVDADIICGVINHACCPSDYALRFWRVVENDYKLQPGFEP